MRCVLLADQVGQRELLGGFFGLAWEVTVKVCGVTVAMLPG